MFHLGILDQEFECQGEQTDQGCCVLERREVVIVS